MKSFSVALLTMSAGVVLTPQLARADAEPAPLRYTVQQGDTCASISAHYYGDERLVDVIHDANAGMGPPPHALRPGQMLVLPPKPALTTQGPDARLTRTKNVVEVRAPEPRTGKPNDPLFRGNRVGTRESATADVTFRDETQVKLGENTLVVILGDARARAARLGATDTTLVTGSLRARLSELAGKGGGNPRVATDSGSVEMKNGEAQVSVDEKKTTRLAVYDGTSTLTAQRKAVDVVGGFGSKAETGRPPTPPKPLPDAPLWSAPVPGLVIADANVDLVLSFAPATHGSGPAAAEWHLQLARDADFAEPLVDARMPLATRSIEAKNAEPGRYFARASAIDDDHFEGKWSSVASVVVASLASTPLPGRKTRIAVTPEKVACSVDGAVQPSQFEVDRTASHTIACETEDNQHASVEMARLPLGRLIAGVAIEQHGGRSGARAATVRLHLTDEAGLPIDHVGVVVEASPPGMFVGTFVPGESPGTYIASASVEPTSTGGQLRLRVADEVAVKTNALAIEPDATPAPAPAETTHVELTAAGRVARVLEQAGFGGSLGVRLAVPTSSGALLLGVEGIFEAIPPARSHVGELGEQRVRADIWGARFPLGYRFGTSSSKFAPYVALGPELLFTRARVGPESTNVASRSMTFGGGAGAGLEMRLRGRSAAFVELSGRLLVDIESATKGPAIDASAAALSLGYRYGL